MYLNLIVAAFVAASATDEACSGKSNAQCIKEVSACGAGLTKALSLLVAEAPKQVFKNPIGTATNIGRTLSRFLRKPILSTTSHSTLLDSGTGSLISEILHDFLEPLWKVLDMTGQSKFNPDRVTLMLVSKFLVNLEKFAKNEEYRKSSQMTSILPLILPVVTTISDKGLKCMTEAVGGMQKHPMLIIDWTVGFVVNYMQECFVDGNDLPQSCTYQQFFVEVGLSLSITLVTLLEKLTAAGKLSSSVL